jgi:hypothetical protein
MLKAALAGAMLAVTAGAAFAADPPATTPAANPPKAYVTEFCGPIALADEGGTALMQQLAAWSGHAAPEGEADAARPVDADAPGQLFRFADKAAPPVFVERRRGVCSLIYPTAHIPDAVARELATEALPVNGKAPASTWRRARRSKFGPPGPLRYFLKVGESEGFGLCSTIFEDLRLRDGSPATMVRVTTCRLGPDEKLDNG